MEGRRRRRAIQRVREGSGLSTGCVVTVFSTACLGLEDRVFSARVSKNNALERKAYSHLVHTCFSTNFLKEKGFSSPVMEQ